MSPRFKTKLGDCSQSLWPKKVKAKHQKEKWSIEKGGQGGLIQMKKDHMLSCFDWGKDSGYEVEGRHRAIITDLAGVSPAYLLPNVDK